MDLDIIVWPNRNYSKLIYWILSRYGPMRPKFSDIPVRSLACGRGESDEQPHADRIHPAVLPADQHRVAEVDPRRLHRDTVAEPPAERQLGLEGHRRSDVDPAAVSDGARRTVVEGQPDAGAQ